MRTSLSLVLADRIETALFNSARQTPLRSAVIDGSRSLSYGELAHAARQFACVLQQHGFRPRDRAAIYLDKSIESVVAFYGIWTAGGIAVPLHPSLKSAQIARILSNSGSGFFVSERARIDALDASVLEGVTTLDVSVPGDSAAPAACADRSALPTQHAAAVILYTSGSTGESKGILIGHHNLVAGARIVTDTLGITSSERILSVLPFTFDYGLNQLLTSVLAGATLILQRSHHPADICDTLRRERITGLAGVPLLWIQLMQRQSPLPTLDLPALRYITNSGGAFPLPLLARYRAHLPSTSIYLMYGLTEAFRSTILAAGDVDRHPDSIGQPIAETEILAIDESGRRCEPGEVGELVHAGPTVAMGYWKDPRKTAAVFRPHPLHPGSSRRAVYSGDLVRFDAAGRFYFVGRNDQMMKSQGFRLSPDEVEGAVHRSGLVAAVVARIEPDESLGTKLVIDIVPNQPDGFDLRPLTAFCRREMPSYMIPRRIYVHDSLPRTASGKIDRIGLGAR